MCLKFREEITNPSTLVNLIDDDFGIVFESYSAEKIPYDKKWGTQDVKIIVKLCSFFCF